MFRTALTLVAGAAAFAAPASDRDRSYDAKLEQKLAGMVPGPPQNCINPATSIGAEHFGNTILIKDRGGLLYRTNFRGGCTATRTDSLISRRPSSRLCSGDIVEIRDLAMDLFRGACTYNEFVPYRRPKQ